jgi:tetratricopeptide (TPR) repeat protein
MSKKTMGIIGAVFVIAAASLGLWLSDGVPSDLTLRSLTSQVLHLGAEQSAEKPDLERPLAFPEVFPEEARTIAEQKYATLKQQLITDPDDASAWLDLAILYKTVSDYEGAVLVWKYLASVNPQDSISTHNLGNTYHLFLKKYPESEKYYKEAIARDPNQSLYYVGLHELYRYSYKQESDLAVKTLEEGLTKIPNSPEITIALAAYYKDKGDMANAIKYFTQMRDIAQSHNDAANVAAMNAEIKSLQK